MAEQRLSSKLVEGIRSNQKMYEEIDKQHADGVKAHHALHLDRLKQLQDVTLFNQQTATRRAPLALSRRASLEQSVPPAQTSLRSVDFENAEANHLNQGYRNRQRLASEHALY